MSPQRMQRKRTKGWRMPHNTIYVGRGTVWGNPYKIGDFWAGAAITPETAVALYAQDFQIALNHDPHAIQYFADLRDDLAGKNLACWCPLNKPCHADVLLEIANTKDTK